MDMYGIFEYVWNICGICVDAFWWNLFTPLVDGTAVKHKFSQVAPPDRQICGLKLIGNQSMETMDGNHGWKPYGFV